MSEIESDEELTQIGDNENWSGDDVTIRKAARLKMLKESHERVKKLRNAERQHGESGMQKTESESLKKSESDESGETLPTVSTEQSLQLNREKLLSTSLVDDSMNHLHGLMKGVIRVPKEDAVMLLDPERVKTAVMCAAEIRNLMKIKVEAAKLLFEK